MRSRTHLTAWPQPAPSAGRYLLPSKQVRERPKEAAVQRIHSRRRFPARRGPAVGQRAHGRSLSCWTATRCCSSRHVRIGTLRAYPNRGSTTTGTLVWIRQIKASGVSNRFSEFSWGRPSHLPADLVRVRSVGYPGQVGGVGKGISSEEVAHRVDQPLPADRGRERDAGLLLAQPPEIVG